MNKLIQFIEGKLGNKLVDRKVLLVPGEIFYCHSLPWPSEISESEINQYVELSLEGFSPLGISEVRTYVQTLCDVLVQNYKNRYPNSSNDIVFGGYIKIERR